MAKLPGSAAYGRPANPRRGGTHGRGDVIPPARSAPARGRVARAIAPSVVTGQHQVTSCGTCSNLA